MAAPSSAAAASTVLHTYWRSSCSYRVRIALAYKGVAYASAPVHLVRGGGEQHAPAYAALNPSHRVPTLEIDGLTLVQSGAMIEYLEETRPEPALLPRDAAARAHVRALCACVSNDMQPLGNLAVLQHVAALLPADAPPEARAAARDAWGRHWVALGLAALEALMAPRAGRYSVGDDFSMADVFLAPQAYNAARLGLDLAPYPTIQRVLAALEAHPAVQAAHPSAQPDADKPVI